MVNSPLVVENVTEIVGEPIEPDEPVFVETETESIPVPSDTLSLFEGSQNQDVLVAVITINQQCVHVIVLD
jgi:hypothetical protein